jgi:hypothetical protein
VNIWSEGSVIWDDKTIGSRNTLGSAFQHFQQYPGVNTISYVKKPQVIVVCVVASAATVQRSIPKGSASEEQADNLSASAQLEHQYALVISCSSAGVWSGLASDRGVQTTQCILGQRRCDAVLSQHQVVGHDIVQSVSGVHIPEDLQMDFRRKRHWTSCARKRDRASSACAHPQDYRLVHETGHCRS